MADATSILRVLVARYPHPVSIDELVPFLPKTPQRLLGIQAIGTLTGAKLALRNPNLKPAHYTALPKGVDLINKGKSVTSGAHGPRTGISKPRPNLFRARIWRALRTLRTATIDDMVELSLQKGESWGKGQDNARKYLKSLIRADIVVQMGFKQKGTAPSSNGKNRYRLTNDLGPEAPIPCKAWLYDPNAKLLTPPREERLSYIDAAPAPKAKVA